MSSNIFNQIPYIRASREFPTEVKALSLEVDRTYVDIATALNNRTISLFPTNRPAITGESWFLTGQKQQTLRQVYSFTSTANIAHNIDLDEIAGFTRIYGTFTDGTNWYGLLGASNVDIAGQISFYIDPTNIVFLTGAGAPTLTSGTLVLEWLSRI